MAEARAEAAAEREAEHLKKLEHLRKVQHTVSRFLHVYFNKIWNPDFKQTQEEKEEWATLLKEVTPEDVKHYLGRWGDLAFALCLWWSFLGTLWFQLAYLFMYSQVAASQEKLEEWFMGPEPRRPS